MISPLLANLYHACIPHLWNTRGHARRLGGEIVSYADDFVILLPPRRGETALSALRSICERLSLTLNEEKTRLVDALREPFQFLGFEIQKVRNPKTGKRFPRTVPSAKSEQRLRERVREILSHRRGNQPVGEIVSEVNRVVRGWGGYSGTSQSLEIKTRQVAVLDITVPSVSNLSR
ncbi:hypothetical protein HQ520_15205 [bacterium]|nr:hypothetical protein [bacterium]